jgi:S1-C subfamily serine protease
MHRLAFAVAFLAILMVDRGQGQTRNNLLYGLSDIELVIEHLGNHGKTCGLTEPALRAAAMFPLSAAKVDVSLYAQSVLYVNVNTIYVAPAELCVSNIEMQVYMIKRVTLEFSRDEKSAHVELWVRASIKSSARANHLQRVSETIESDTKAFVTDWSLDNKTPRGPAPVQTEQGERRKEPAMALGTGFAITPTGDLVTNKHVVSKCSTVTVKQGNRQFTGTVLFKDTALDLAVIHLNQPPANMSFARLRQSPEAKLGDQVIAFGFPLPGALATDGNVTFGNISALRGLKNDPNEIQISAPIQSGNSGGPLLDLSGNVIGVVSSKLDAVKALLATGDVPQNVNFAIKASVVQAFLDAHGLSYKTAASSSRLEIADVAEQARIYTFSIECLQSLGLAAAVVREPRLRPFPTNAQKVVLYEEDPANPSGTQFGGAAIWRTERVALAPGHKPDVVIRGEIEIPEQNMSLRLSLRRNDDKQLPASHMVEIMFTLPPDFPHGGIANIPGVMMKQGETTRGAALYGVTVRIMTNFFMVGLSSVDADMQRNVQLLKERSWFDIPVVYGDGKRALITIEKGTSGERVFTEAFVAWGHSKGAKADALPKGHLQSLK